MAKSLTLWTEMKKLKTEREIFTFLSSVCPKWPNALTKSVFHHYESLFTTTAMEALTKEGM